MKVWLCEEREMVTDVKTVIGKKLKLDFAKKMEFAKNIQKVQKKTRIMYKQCENLK